jgi:hypothetical protein
VNGLKLLKSRSFGSLRGERRVRSFGDIPKRLGQRLEPKDAHLHSAAHLDLVRRQPCVVTGQRRAVVERDGQRWLSLVVAHHPDELFPAQIGAQKKCSDFLALPILAHLHDDFPGSLHKHGGTEWWDGKPDPYAWLRDFLTRHYPPDHEGASHALALIEERDGR